MPALLVSPAEFKGRLSSKLFWRRMVAAMAVGYIYAALGYSVAFSLFAFVQTSIRYPPENILWGIAGFALLIPHIAIISFLFFLVFAALPMLMLQPLALASALTLRTDRTATLILGAAIGAVLGTPFALAGLPQMPDDLVMAASCAGAGAMFAMALWQMCLKHYVPHPPVAPGRFTTWWQSRNLLVKVGIVIATIPVFIFFL